MTRWRSLWTPVRTLLPAGARKPRWTKSCATTCSARSTRACGAAPAGREGRGAARVRTRRARQGRLPPVVGVRLADTAGAGSAHRRAHAAAQPRLHRHPRRDGARHLRQHRHLQRRLWRRAEAAALRHRRAADRPPHADCRRSRGRHRFFSPRDPRFPAAGDDARPARRAPLDDVIFFGHDEPERLRTGVVSADYFDALGIAPLHGRLFVPGDDTPEAPGCWC